MNIVKLAAKIMDERPDLAPMEALAIAREQAIYPPREKRTETEKAILRARREWKRQRRNEIVESITPSAISVSVTPRAGACDVTVRIGKDEYGAVVVPEVPVFTYAQRVRASAARLVRAALKVVYQ